MRSSFYCCGPPQICLEFLLQWTEGFLLSHPEWKTTCRDGQHKLCWECCAMQEEDGGESKIIEIRYFFRWVRFFLAKNIRRAELHQFGFALSSICLRVSAELFDGNGLERHLQKWGERPFSWQRCCYWRRVENDVHVLSISRASQLPSRHDFPA